MKQRALFFVIALVLSGGAQAQSNEELKGMLDQALKTIQDLQNRVKALEQQKEAAPAAPAPTAAKAPAPEQPSAAPALSQCSCRNCGGRAGRGAGRHSGEGRGGR